MAQLHYHLVDVFTDRQFGGNQLAVVENARGLSGEVMQAITREFNLSETSFVLPPEDPANTYKLRIFTTGREMLMAGHPTVGTCFVLARERLVDGPANGDIMIRLEEGVGLIPVKVAMADGAPDLVTMTQPLPTFGPVVEDRATIAEMLSLEEGALDPDLPVEVVSCGVPFIYVPVKRLRDMHRIKVRPDIWERALQGFVTADLFIFSQEVEYASSTVHSRMMAPDLGISEDPATGAASGPLGCYLLKHGLVSPERGTAHILSEQGVEMGRPSFIHIEIDSRGKEITGVRIAGRSRYVGHGFLELDSLDRVG